MSTKPYDQAFKYFAEQDAESLLILLGYLKPGEAAEIEPLPLELSVSTLLTDQAYLVKRGSKQFIVHPEAQIAWKDDLLERMPDYDARLWMKYRLPIYSNVLLLTRKGLPKPVPHAGIIHAGSLKIESSFRVTKIWESSAQQYLAMKRDGILPFIPLMRGSYEDLEASVKLLRAVKDKQKQRDLGVHFLMLGGLRYNRADLLEMILEKGMIPLKEFKESSFYQMVLDEGREEGREAGREEGREAGREAGLTKTLLLLVAHKFPALDVKAKIESINDAALLEKLYKQALEAKDADTFLKRLARIRKR
ncbi:MAG: hypothetical protein HY231_25285 [Acidobacteria bacterium]|nr:hypothetical protein [Acidobacteriota bacterium]